MRQIESERSHSNGSTDGRPSEIPSRSTGTRSASSETPNHATTDETRQSEDIYLRNYDPYHAYELTVSVTDERGELAFEGEYRFQPGQVESVTGVLDPGTYEVTVELDGRRRKRVECRVGESPEKTIHVELGNGIVSVTEGLYG